MPGRSSPTSPSHVEPGVSSDLAEPLSTAADLPPDTRLPPSSHNAREFRQMVESFHEGVIIVSSARIEFANRVVRGLLPEVGHAGGEPLRFLRAVAHWMPREQRTTFVGTVARVVRGQQPSVDGEYSLTVPGRPKVYLHLDVRSATFEQAPALLIALRDETESHTIQEKLTRAEHMASIGTLAAGVAHEINNPLAYVTTNIAYCVERLRYIDALLKGEGIQLGSPASLLAILQPMSQALREAHEGTMRVATIVRDLRHLTRDDRDTDAPVDLQTVLETALHMCENEYRFRASLVRDFDGIGTVLGNHTRLVQVFVNLIVNAAQAFAAEDPSKNSIRLHGFVDGASTIVEVIDNGPGIPEEAIGQIFAPFFTTKAVGVGMGLGLSICHGIVYACGGTIVVESKPGMGATFRVTLRTSEEQVPSSLPKSSGVRPEGRARILVIDDEPLILRSVSRLLRDQHDVEVAVNGNDGLQKIVQDGPFDLIVCDLMMPEMTGMELYNEVRKRSPDTAARFVFLTGGAFTEGARAFLASVDNPKLDKPVQPTLLRDVVHGALVATA
jgi:two-component system, cell cycle sensor histidine kinase and response regulator CckA